MPRYGLCLPTKNPEERFSAILSVPFRPFATRAYYLPYDLRTATAGLFRPTGMYQLVYLSDGKSPSRPPMDSTWPRRFCNLIREHP